MTTNQTSNINAQGIEWLVLSFLKGAVAEKRAEAESRSEQNSHPTT